MKISLRILIFFSLSIAVVFAGQPETKSQLLLVNPEALIEARTTSQTPSFLQPDALKDVLLLNKHTLNSVRDSYQKNPKKVSSAIKALIRKAQIALKARPVSVVEKHQIPPSGDKHDYMSIAPYWWPDPSKPDGLPYMRKDGKVNPDRYKVGDREFIGRMNENVWTLALAYIITGDEKYAQAAIRQLNVWFLDPATKMNPNLNYAQSVKGQNLGRGTGIIDSHGFRNAVDAIILLRTSSSWTAEMDRGIQSWFEQYLTWLLESENGKEECAAKNNHGSTYDVQVVCIAQFLGKNDIARRVLSEVGQKRIAVQIEPDGSQPLELERTKTWGYSMLNLEALVNLAILGNHVGIDIWQFETADGRSIRKAIEFLIPYAEGKQTWKWKQIVPFEYGRLYPILLQATEGLNDSLFLQSAQRIRNKFEFSSSVVFSLPAQ